MMTAHFDDYYGHGVPGSVRDLACEFRLHRAGYMARGICGAIVCSDGWAYGRRVDARCHRAPRRRCLRGMPLL
ncbi:MAG TPA: hypothetical protein VE733_01910 [Streptosporangiaceae bacterium]|jgi:hypothetical protein|nr:hypothetical protein [Streptosporangiaceae bacterium]